MHELLRNNLNAFLHKNLWLKQSFDLIKFIYGDCLGRHIRKMEEFIIFIIIT